MRTGLEKLLDDPKRWLSNARVGLVANPASVDRRLVHAVDLLHRHEDVDLRLLFGPEHGIRGNAQDMVEVGDACDAATGLREVSLYGNNFASLSPSAEHLSQIDVLAFDVQDIGARYYTYVSTMALAMEAAGGARIVQIDDGYAEVLQTSQCLRVVPGAMTHLHEERRIVAQTVDEALQVPEGLRRRLEAPRELRQEPEKAAGLHQGREAAAHLGQ